MIKWNVSPDLFQLGPLTIRWYGLMFVIGGLLMSHYARRRFTNYGRDPLLVGSLTTHFIAGMTIGARLVHCLFYDPLYYLENPLKILMVWEGGLASHGGAIGIIIAVWIFLKKHPELSFFWLLDIIVGPAAFAGGLVRIGNFFNSEIYGEPTTLPWAVVFERVDQLPRHPTQLYEALGYFFMAAVLIWMERKKTKSYAPGSVLAVTLVLAFTFRFLIEFMKTEQSSLTTTLPINMGQLLSLGFVISGVVLWFKLNPRAKH